MQRRAFLIVSAAAFAALTSPAAAHAMLAHAEPPVGATVQGPVNALRLRFTERIEPALCRLTLAHDGHDTALTDLRAEGDGRILTAHLPPLAPGAYTVRWRAVSLDTHVTERAYSFTIATWRCSRQRSLRGLG